MRVELGFLETKVARRLLFLFVFCAVLPITALATVSYRHVAQHLRRTHQERVDDLVAGTQDLLRDRLQVAEGELGVLSSALALPELDPKDAGALAARAASFAAVALDRGGRAPTAVLGSLPSIPELSAEERRYLEQDRPLFRVVRYAQGTPELLLARTVPSAEGPRTIVWARLRSGFLWDGVPTAPYTGGELAIVDASLAPLYGPLSSDETFRTRLSALVGNGEEGTLSWTAEGEPFQAVAIPLRLGSPLEAPAWHLVVSVPAQAITAPLRDFTQRFLPVMLTALLIVLLLSDVQIRRTIQPLKRLKEGTRRIADEHFDTTVDISSNDEFQELADSFNRMAQRLGEQFGTLTVIREVDQAALEEAEGRQLIDPLLRGMRSVVRTDTISVCLLDTEDPHQGVCYTVVGQDSEVDVEHVTLARSDLTSLETQPQHIDTPAGAVRPAYLMVTALAANADAGFASLPLVLRGGPAGVVSFPVMSDAEKGSAHLLRARQVADQLALALSNVRRLRALDRFNWGALTALARTIDANSPWTAGHSERVAELATLIATQMGLSEKDVDIVQRGALLHDIGKIGVPMEILNKAGPLSEEEMAAVREHTVIGARILEPIAEYAELLPIVLHHHERIDGRGYPNGQRGDAIDLNARILSVADTFDALTSDRPYRRGLPPRTAIEVVRNAAGTQLDVKVVEAFLALHEAGALEGFTKKEKRSAKKPAKPEALLATTG
ncbi:MAG: HD domain-containing protein [Gemmatimonadota bacterium]